MKTLTKVTVLAILGFASAAWAAPSLLIRYRYRLVFPPDNLEFEQLIYRDGVTVERLADLETGKVFLSRCQPNTTALAQLASSLQANGIGQLHPGLCKSINPTPGDYFDVALDWFGKPPRENHLQLNPIAVEGDGTGPCPAEVNQAILSARAYISSQSDCTTAQIVPWTTETLP